MQHDTTVSTASCWRKARAAHRSSLYLRFSKRRYLKFYRVFNRFRMKCFLHERSCSGATAPATASSTTPTWRACVAVAAMPSSCRRWSLRQAVRLPIPLPRDRPGQPQAGEERSFYTVESNFLPGRSFASLEDLNAQPPVGHRAHGTAAPGQAGLIPAQAFEHESARLCACRLIFPPPIGSIIAIRSVRIRHLRGQLLLGASTTREAVRLLSTATGSRSTACTNAWPIPLAADGIKNAHSARGPTQPRYQPHQRRQPTQQEETGAAGYGRSRSAATSTSPSSPGHPATPLRSRAVSA